jgi:hypothetical protein
VLSHLTVLTLKRKLYTSEATQARDCWVDGRRPT